MIRDLNVTVNGASRVFPADTTLDALVEREGHCGRGFAVAVDGEVIPRARWAEFALLDGQAVEVVVAVQGG